MISARTRQLPHPLPPLGPIPPRPQPASQAQGNYGLLSIDASGMVRRRGRACWARY